jgi:uncharacterized protein (TIGR02246 family)
MASWCRDEEPMTRRRAIRAAVLCTMLLLPAMRAAAAPAAAPADDVTAALQAWASAYDSRSPARIVALYAPGAVFWGTSSPVLRDTPALIADYFKNMAAQPQARVEISSSKVQVWGDIAAASGIYTFTDVRNGETVRRPARFTFVFQRQDGRWVIVDHHSSAMPAQP